jgi:hypothetical protein
MLVNLGGTFRALTQYWLAGEIDRFGVFPVAVLSWPKSNSGSQVVVELDGGGKGAPHLVAEAGQRADLLRSVSRVSISAGSNWRPATIFHSA